jgi:thiol-disulfide isomerase/thioredoxin
MWMWLNRCFLVVLFGALYLTSSCCQAEIVQLTDGTFEHQTQASTGATTGSWFIMFHAPSCPSCDSLKPVFNSLDQEPELYENGIVLGSLDISGGNQDTGKRFGISAVPALLYIHKGHVYRFPGDEWTLELMKSFVLEDYSKVQAEPIPDPPSALKEILDLIQGNRMVGMAVTGMVVLLIGTVGLLIVTLSRGKNKNKSD